MDIATLKKKKRAVNPSEREIVRATLLTTGTDTVEQRMEAAEIIRKSGYQIPTEIEEEK